MQSSWWRTLASHSIFPASPALQLLGTSETFLIFRGWWPVPLPAVMSPVWPGLSPSLLVSWLSGPTDLLQLYVPVVDTHGQHRHQEDDGEDETDPGLVIINKAVTVVTVVSVPAPVHDHHTQRACHEQDDEQPNTGTPKSAHTRDKPSRLTGNYCSCRREDSALKRIPQDPKICQYI